MNATRHQIRLVHNAVGQPHLLGRGDVGWHPAAAENPKIGNQRFDPFHDANVPRTRVERLLQTQVGYEARVRKLQVGRVGHRNHRSRLEIVIGVQRNIRVGVDAEPVDVRVVALQVDHILGHESFAQAGRLVGHEDGLRGDVPFGETHQFHQKGRDRVAVGGLLAGFHPHGTKRAHDRGKSVGVDIIVAELHIRVAQHQAIGSGRHVALCHVNRRDDGVAFGFRLSCQKCGMGRGVGGDLQLGAGRHHIAHVHGIPADQQHGGQQEQAEGRRAAVLIPCKAVWPGQGFHVSSPQGAGQKPPR